MNGVDKTESDKGNTFSFDSPQEVSQEPKRIHVSDEGILMTAEEYLEDIRQKAVARYKPIRDKEKEIREKYTSEEDKARMEVEKFYGVVNPHVEISDFDRKFGRKTVGQERYGGLPKFSKPSPNSPKIENPADPDTIEPWAKDVPEGWFRIGNDLVQPLNPYINKHIRKVIRSVDQKKRDKYEAKKEIQEKREAKEREILIEHGKKGLDNYRADKAAKTALAEERRLRLEAQKAIDFVLNPDNHKWIINKVKSNAVFKSLPEYKKVNIDYTSYISHLWEVLQREVKAGRGFDSKYFQKRDKNRKTKPVKVEEYVGRYIGYIACQIHVHQDGVYYGNRSGVNYSKLNQVIRVLEDYKFNMNTDFEVLTDIELDLVEFEVLNEPIKPNTVTYFIGVNKHPVGQLGFQGLDFQSSCDDIEFEGVEHLKVFIVLSDAQATSLKSGQKIHFVYDFKSYIDKRDKMSRFKELRQLKLQLGKIQVRIKKVIKLLTEKGTRLYELTPYERDGKDFLQKMPYIFKWVEHTKQVYVEPIEEDDLRYTEWGEVIASNPTLEEQKAREKRMQEQEAERLIVESTPGPAGYQFVPKSEKVLGADRLKIHEEIRRLRREVIKLSDELDELNQEAEILDFYFDRSEFEKLEKWFEVDFGMSGKVSGVEFQSNSEVVSNLEKKLCKQLSISNRKLSLDILKSERSCVHSEDTSVSLDKEYGNSKSSDTVTLKDYIPEVGSKIEDWEVEIDFRHYMTNLIIRTKRAGNECHKGFLQFIVGSKYFQFDHFYGQTYPEEAMEGKTLRGTRMHFTKTFSDKGLKKLVLRVRKVLLLAFKTEEQVDFVLKKVFEYISLLGYKRASEIIQDLDFKRLDSTRYSKYQTVFGQELEGRRLIADLDYDSDSVLGEASKSTKTSQGKIEFDYMNSEDEELDPDDILTEEEIRQMWSKVSKKRQDVGVVQESTGVVIQDESVVHEPPLAAIQDDSVPQELVVAVIQDDGPISDEDLNLPDEEDMIPKGKARVSRGKVEGKVWASALALNISGLHVQEDFIPVEGLLGDYLSDKCEFIRAP